MPSLVKVIEYIRERVLMSKFGFSLDKFHIGKRDCGMDGRSYKRVLKDLVEAGYLEDPKDVIRPTMKSYDELVVSSPDLVAEWIKLNPPHEHRQVDYIPVFRLKHEEQKYLAENAASYEFFWVYEDVITFRARVSNSKLNIHGPFPAGEASLQYKIACDAKELGDKTRLASFTLCVQSKGLQAWVREKRAEEQFQEVYQKNLAWGTETLGLLPEEEANLLSSHKNDGFFSSYGNLGLDPNKWASVCDQNIEQTAKEIEQIQKSRSVLIHLRDKVKSMGGWDTFLERYASRVREELAKPKGV